MYPTICSAHPNDYSLSLLYLAAFFEICFTLNKELWNSYWRASQFIPAKSDVKADSCVLMDSFFLLRKQWSADFAIPDQTSDTVSHLYMAARHGCI